jgi:quercetin dioxygenase-like cupin family protein
MMERKEPYASQEEYSKYVIRYQDIPPIELIPGAHIRIVPARNMTLSFAGAKANSFLPPHRHEESEQIMVILDGALEFIIEGKLYHVEKSDVVVLPPNTEHGAYVTDKNYRGIDIFSPPRQDFVAKLEEVKKKQKQ